MQLSRSNINKVLRESRTYTDRILKIQIRYLNTYSNYYLINERFYDFSTEGKILTNMDSVDFFTYMDQILSITEEQAYLKVYRDIDTTEFLLTHPNIIRALKLDYDFIPPMDFADISISHLYQHLQKLNDEDSRVGKMFLNSGNVLDLDNQFVYVPIYSFTPRNIIDINKRLSQLNNFRGVRFNYHLINEDLTIRPEKIIVNLQPNFGSMIIDRGDIILSKNFISYKTYLYLLDLCFKYSLSEKEFTDLIYELNRYYTKEGQN